MAAKRPRSRATEAVVDLTFDGDDAPDALLPKRSFLKTDVQSPATAKQALRDCWTRTHYPAKYFADSSTGRAACKEFRCGEIIPKGKLRLGILNDECSPDYFHPACLFKTFHYKQRANKRISSVDEISFDRCGNEADELRAKVEELLDEEELFGRNRKAQDADCEDVNSSPVKSEGSYAPYLQIRDDVAGSDGEDEEWEESEPGQKVFVYNSYDIKEKLKVLGFRFNSEERAWWRPLSAVLKLTDEFYSAQDITLSKLLDLAPETGGKQDETRVYINCPYHDKDEAKALGARWDRERRSWFVPQGHDNSPDVSLFSRWM